MNKFRLSSRLFSYVFWESILSSTDINDGKREKIISRAIFFRKIKKKKLIIILDQFQMPPHGAYTVL